MSDTMIVECKCSICDKIIEVEICKVGVVCNACCYYWNTASRKEEEHNN